MTKDGDFVEAPPSHDSEESLVSAAVNRAIEPTHVILEKPPGLHRLEIGAQLNLTATGGIGRPVLGRLGAEVAFHDHLNATTHRAHESVEGGCTRYYGTRGATFQLDVLPADELRVVALLHFGELAATVHTIRTRIARELSEHIEHLGVRKTGEWLLLGVPRLELLDSDARKYGLLKPRTRLAEEHISWRVYCGERGRRIEQPKICVISARWALLNGTAADRRLLVVCARLE